MHHGSLLTDQLCCDVLCRSRWGATWSIKSCIRPWLSSPRLSSFRLDIYWIQETETQEIEQPDAASFSVCWRTGRSLSPIFHHCPHLSVGLFCAHHFLWRNIVFRLRWGMDFWQPISKKYGDSLGQEPLGLSPIMSYQQKLRGGHVLRGTLLLTWKTWQPHWAWSTMTWHRQICTCGTYVVMWFDLDS